MGSSYSFGIRSPSGSMARVDLPALLSSEQKLRQYMSGEEQIRTIAKEAINPPVSSLWQGKWQVVILTVTKPFDGVLIIFWEATRGLAYVLCMPTLSTYCHIRSMHVSKDHRLYTISRLGQDLLVPSMNLPKSSLADLCAHPSLSREVVKSNPLLTDTRKGSPFSPKSLEFFHKKGTCRGMSDWFLYLYFATKDLFSDPEEHLKAVARRMETGATAQATLLQTFDYTDGLSVLDLFRTPICDPNSEKFGTIPYKLFKKDNSEAKDIIHNLPLGAYHLGVAFHAMTFVKSSPTLGYLFDPNQGLIRMRGDLPNKLFQYCLKYKQLNDSPRLKKYAEFIKPYGPEVLNKVNFDLAFSYH